MVVDRTGGDGWRMTGSAFASYRGAGRCIQGGSAGYLRSTKLREGKGRGRLHRTEGWRMTGSAFAILIARGTLY